MSDIRLPQRPMVELPPPIDGLDQVRGAAGRRRRRRAGVLGASLTTAAGIAVVLSLSGGPGGLAVLKPAPPAGPGLVQPSPTATGAVGVDPAKRHQHVAARRPSTRGQQPGHAAQVSRSGQGTDMQPPPPTDVAPESQGQVSRTQQPTLSRWQSTYTGGARECTGSTYSGPDGTFESAVGWCATAIATSLSDGVRLHLQLCRDSTGGGTLTFSGTREVDLEVRDGSRTVWDWAKLHPGSAGPHQLSAIANGCWNWSVLWPDVTQSGAPAGHGVFTFVGTSAANEMKGSPDYSTNFGY